MDQTLSLGWTRGAATSRRRTYRGLLGASLALHAILALVAILHPATLAGYGPVGAAALRAWGGLVLVLVLFALPGWLDPLRARWANLANMLGGYLLAIVYLAAGCLWLAVAELLIAIGLSLLYLNLARAELMSRP